MRLGCNKKRGCPVFRERARTF